MSQARYTELWKRAQSEITGILRIELPLKVKRLPTDRDYCFDEISGRYVKYCMIYKALQSCFDHVVHPQKHILIGKMLDGVSGRLIEMRHELERLAVNEYVNLVDICHEKKIPVDGLELNLSKTQTMLKMNSTHQRAIFLDYILHTTGEEGDRVSESAFVCTVEEAVLLIQRNQRAFIARNRAKNLKRRQEIAKRMAKQSDHMEAHMINGIIKFQNLWRGYRIRCTLTDIRAKTAEFIGMHMPEGSNLDIQKKQIHSKDYERLMEYDDEYRKDHILKTDEIMETKSKKMEDDLLREIREWVLEYYDVMGAFPQFPTEEEGGSLALYSHKTIEELSQDMDELEEYQRSGKKPPKQKKAAKKKDKGKKKKGKGQSEFHLRPSNFIDSEMVPYAQEYGEYWMFNEEKDNPRQHYDGNLLTEDVLKDVEGTIRKQVDKLMREELEKLAIGIGRQRPPKPKHKKEKKKREKKKKKKGKDFTEGIPIEELYKELILAGVVKRVPFVHLADYVGEVNLLCPKDSEDMEFKHDLGDVRRMIFDYAVLPMSSPVVHAKAPLVKSILIVGPHGSGKKMLVHAICTELGANLFDLSPDNIAGIYEDSDGQKRLMQLVMKVAKSMEPSVIFIGNCDRMFTKKLPPEDTTRPARMKKDIMKAIKSITPNDRILLVGTSKKPFGAALGPLFKLYEKLIFIYPPSSRSRYALWKRLINDAKGIMPWPQFQLTPLTQVSKGYTAGDIKNTTLEVLTEKRIKRQQNIPLITKEFVNRLSSFEPVYMEEQEEFEKWLNKTPLQKKLNKIRDMENDGKDIMDHL